MTSQPISEAGELVARLRQAGIPGGEHYKLHQAAADLIERLSRPPRVDEAMVALRSLEKVVGHFCRNYLLDERDRPEICMDQEHHLAVLDLFDAREAARAAISAIEQGE